MLNPKTTGVLGQNSGAPLPLIFTRIHFNFGSEQIWEEILSNPDYPSAPFELPQLKITLEI